MCTKQRRQLVELTNAGYLMMNENTRLAGLIGLFQRRLNFVNSELMRVDEDLSRTMQGMRGPEIVSLEAVARELWEENARLRGETVPMPPPWDFSPVRWAQPVPADEVGEGSGTWDGRSMIGSIESSAEQSLPEGSALSHSE